MTGYKRSLRTRVVIAFALTGALIGSVFALVAYILAQSVELQFINETLEGELRHYIDHIENNSQTPVPSWMWGYVTTPGEEARLPHYLDGLGPGTYDLDEGDLEYHVAVQDQGSKRFYLVYDPSRDEYWEVLLNHLLPVSVLGITCLAYCLGRWLSIRVLAPVTKLAAEVRGLSEDPRAGRPISTYGDDEVGDLARAFDQLVRRLRAFAKREAEFTADVSHELRTPVAVVRTTTELLLSQTGTEDEPVRKPLRRLDRAGRQMSSLIDVFLMLARASEPSREETAKAWPLEPVVRELLDARKEDLTHKRLAVELETDGRPKVRAPRAVLIVVFGNLLSNAIAYTQNGRIRISLDEQEARVEDTGAGITEHDEPHIFRRHYRGRQPPEGQGSGLGLAIVQRLCQRYGWRIGVESTKGQGTRIWLAFSPG